MRHQALDNGPNKLTDQTKQVSSFKKVNVRKPWLIGMIATEWNGERLLVRQCTQVTRQMQLLAESKPWDSEHIPEISSLVMLFLNEKIICTYWGQVEDLATAEIFISQIKSFSLSFITINLFSVRKNCTTCMK